MTALGVRAAPSFSPRSTSSERRIWGFDVRELYGRYWSAKGWKTVVRGAREIPGPDKRGYMLIEPDEFVFFDPPLSLRPTPKRPTTTVRVSVIQYETQSYDVIVEADESGRFERIRRRYSPKIRAEVKVVFTDDPTIALAWSRAENTRIGQVEIRTSKNISPSRTMTIEGVVIESGDKKSYERLQRELTSRCSGLETPDDRLTEISPAVWVDKSAHIGSGVTFVGPVWIGAGQILVPGDTVIGPCVLPDVIATNGKADVTFRDLIEPIPADHAATISRQLPFERSFNLLFSLAALLLTLPLYPLIMLLIWLEDGRPFFFRHMRQTRGGREFGCYKFRTMCRDAEKLKARLKQANASDGPQFHMPDDPRLLRVGKFLRRFYLDELPQFYNMLKGDMNLVGPRPSPDAENQFCPAWREARLSVKPGITGLWQVCRTRRPNVDFQEWIRFDLEYVQKRSWRLDLWIIMKTFRKVISQSNR